MDHVRAKHIAAELQGLEVGKWTVGGYLGNGASAVVLSAEKEGRSAAVKLIDPELVERFGEAQQLERIQRERDLIGSRHGERHLIKIFDGGKCETTGYLYVVMELLAEPQLTDMVSSFPQERIGPIIEQLAGAAAFLERQGLVHRDIKPDNIVITRDCQSAVLLDCGVVRPIADAQGHDGGTGDSFLGTTRYSPPEYIAREEEDTVEGWRAVTFYQLGAVLHDLIMKQRLFHTVGQPVARLIDAVRETRPVVEAPDVAPHLVELARNCLHKNWRVRLATVEWENFKAEPRPLGGADAKLRIRERLDAIAGGGGQLTTAVATAPLSKRRFLEDTVGVLTSAVREICLHSGTFPPIELNPEVADDSLQVDFSTGPSQRHALENRLVIKIVLEPLDEEGMIVNVRGASAVGGFDWETAGGEWLEIYSGDLSAPALRAELDSFLHLALDAAQRVTVPDTNAVLRLG